MNGLIVLDFQVECASNNLCAFLAAGVARIFQRGSGGGGGGHKLCQTEGTHQIVVFSPPEYCRFFCIKRA